MTHSLESYYYPKQEYHTQHTQHTQHTLDTLPTLCGLVVSTMVECTMVVFGMVFAQNVARKCYVRMILD